MKRFLDVREGLDVGSPKQCVRASLRVGLLTDEQAEAALAMADDRNLIGHVYREAVARDIDARLSARAATRAAWTAAIQRRLSGGEPSTGA